MILEPFYKHSMLRDNFERSIVNLLRAGQLFGVVPWNVPLEVKNGLWREDSYLNKSVRVINVIYSLGIIVAVCIATVFHYSVFISTDFFAIRTLYISEDVAVNVIVILTLIGCQYLRTFYAKFAEEIVTIGDELYSVGGTIGFRQIETTVRRVLYAALLYFGALLASDFLHSYAWPHRFVYRTVLYTVPNVINLLALYQYVVLLWFVEHSYRTINRLLKVLGRSAASSAERPQMASRSKHHGFKKKVLHMSTSVVSYDHVELIDRLRRTHLKISNLTVQVNGCFGALIVCTMLSSFVVLSLQLFGVYKVMTAIHWSYLNCTKLVYSLLWIGLHAAKVLLILYPCHLVQRERDRTGPLLYSFHHSFANSSMHNALIKFSSQLLHEKECHTACGLLSLDMSLISTMVGALTTYLVILIQFDSAFVKDAVQEGTPSP